MRRTCTMLFLVYSLSIGFPAVMRPVRPTRRQAGTTLFDGKSLAAFNTIGDANWRLMDGLTRRTKATATGDRLLRRLSIWVEFWADDDANSGVFCVAKIRSKLRP